MPWSDRIGRRVKLRELRTIGHHFRRQSPIASYIVDFECRRSRLVVEVDGHQHGFDDRYRTYSLGLVLMGLTIRAAIDEGTREFDMLWGVEPYKFLWTRDVCALQRIELFPSDLGGALQRRAVLIRLHAGKIARHFVSISKALGF